jgi:CRP/FNR family cyclic AMP-dependent transcriptional regulator
MDMKLQSERAMRIPRAADLGPDPEALGDRFELCCPHIDVITDLLGHAPAMQPLDRVFQPGEYVVREGDPANSFYVITRGSVAIETSVPYQEPVTIETLRDGDLLGWSWLVPPYCTTFDARAVRETHALEFDATCLRRRLDSDIELGYVLLRLFAAVIVERVEGTRIRLLDAYRTKPSR